MSLARPLVALSVSLLLLLPERATAVTPNVGSGVGYSAALGADGLVRTWGNDEAGALGLGRTLFSCAAPVPGAVNMIEVSAGGGHALAIAADRTVLGWGNNASGQVGDGTKIQRSTPVAVSGLSSVLHVAAGNGHSVAVTTDGRIWEWGYPTGELPKRLEGVDDITDISIGFDFQLALRRDGTVWGWGFNAHGQLGDGTTTERFTPAMVAGLDRIIQVSAGTDFALALRDDGTVWAWGSNAEWGSLGDGTHIDRSRPVMVLGLPSIASIEAGHGTAFAVARDGAVWGWGRNGQNELGLNSFDSKTLPVVLPGIIGPSYMQTGYNTFIALMPLGTLVGWGLSDACQLGVSGGSRIVPTALTGISGVRMLSVGGDFSLALLEDGRVLSWGENNKGQLGNTLDLYRTTPARVAIDNVTEMASGWYHVLALKADGSVWGWGENSSGQLGDGTGISRVNPVAATVLGAGSGIRKISAGARHSLALGGDGSVWSWGYDYQMQLGTREGTDPSVPSRVAGLGVVDQISAGGGHNLVLRRDRTVWAWGANDLGQLGDGTRGSDRRQAQPISGLSEVVLISAGGWHSVVKKSDGTLWAWGRNDYGQLGDGTYVDRLTPVQVMPNLTDVVALSAGVQYTLALRSDGTVWGWGGAAIYGSSNDGIPGPIPGLANVGAISAKMHSLVVAKDGLTFAWGGNDLGQMGDGTLLNRYLPVIVLREGGAGSFAGNDWFLDLEPSRTKTIPPDKVPPLLVVASTVGAEVIANLRFRPEDIGKTAGIFVFARAPANIVKGAVREKDGSVGCVLAQLNASGSLQAVSTTSLQAYVTGVLTGQGQAVSVLNGVGTATIGGATFYVGYGASPTAMLTNGTNRGVVSVQGSQGDCKPQPPQTGWWWNSAEGGRGYSIEVAGNHLVFASYLYDVTGRATWLLASGNTSLDGSMFVGKLESYSGGQTLAGSYKPPAGVVGQDITMAFADATHGTMIWPGGSIGIERFNIVPNGLGLAPMANQPEAGWWWNPAESGRGYFLEWQGGQLFMAGYMYDDAGNPIWYLSGNSTPSTNPQSYSNNWLQFGNGQTLTGTYRAPTQVNGNVAPVTIQFSGPETGIMTLPNGRTSAISRFRF